MRIRFYTNIIIFFILLSLPKIVFGTEFTLSSPIQNIYGGDDFIVNLNLDTQGVNINTVAGSISYPADLLNIKEIRSGNSLVNFWVDAPHASGTLISFSGIIPGGYNGTGLVVSIVFTAKQMGLGKVSMSDFHVLRNDGSGSEVSTSMNPFSFSVTTATSSVRTIITAVIDTEAPETFVPEVAQNSTIFNGQFFVAFSTTDKGSGIAKYQVKESKYPLFSFLSVWHDGESPYVLIDQNLQSYISVKAIDKAGNIRIETINPQNSIPLLGVGIIVAFLWKRKKI